MNISPISNVKFGALYADDKEYSDSQNQIINRIKEALNDTAPFDKKNRSYSKYIDQKGYDVLLKPEQDDKVKAYVLIQPRTYEQVELRKAGVFKYSEDFLAGVYDKEHSFKIDDVMELVNEDIKKTRNIVLGAILPVLGFVLFAATLGVLKYCNPHSKEPKVIEQIMQDTTKIAKDTLQLFKK